MSEDIWNVTDCGLPTKLRVVELGLEIASDARYRQLLWSEILEISFPASFSVSIVAAASESLTLGFASRSEQRRFRARLDEATSESNPTLESSLIVERLASRSTTPATFIVSLHHVPGRTVVACLGFVTAHTVISRNMVSDFGSDLKSTFGGNLGGLEKAIESGIGESTLRLQRAGRERGADTVLGVTVVVESVTDKAQAIVMSGTAVRTVAESRPGSPQDERDE